MNDAKRYYTNSKKIKELYRLAYIIHNTLIKHNIVYFADSGTLLGALRHKGIINWDNDIDLCISYNDYDYILNDLQKEFKKQGCHVRIQQNGWLQVLSRLPNERPKVEAIADLFPIELVKKNLKTNRVVKTGSKKYYEEDKNTRWIYQYSGKNERRFWPNLYHYLEDVFPLKEVKFGSGIILVPKFGENMLNRFYGPDWKTVGYLTQNPEDHEELEEPIKIKITSFTPAKEFYNGIQKTQQIRLNKNHPYLLGNPVDYLQS